LLNVEFEVRERLQERGIQTEECVHSMQVLEACASVADEVAVHHFTYARIIAIVGQLVHPNDISLTLLKSWA